MTGALEPLDSALRDLNKAKAYKGLSGRVTAVEEAAEQGATKLGQVTPPAEVAGEHPPLVAALQRFGGELRELGGQVGGRDLCTGSAVRTGLGRSDGTSALRDAVKALTAKLPDEKIDLALPGAGSKAARPANGEFIRSGSRGGRGTLTVDNGGSDDAVVTLAKGSKPTISVYIRKGKKFTVSGVSDGNYRIFFTGGTDWDRQARAFGRDCSFQKFEETMDFRTERTATQIRWSTWKITLQPVAGGNAQTTDVPPGDFPTE